MAPSGPAPSFANDIAPLFREVDVRHMLAQSDGNLNLSNYESVKANAPNIYGMVSAQVMPPDAPWSQDKIDLFNQWMQTGMQP